MLDLDRISNQAPPGVGEVLHLFNQLEEQGEPITISINGKADLAVSDDGSFRMLADLGDRLELLEVLKQSIKELDEGKGMSMKEVKEKVPAMVAKANERYDWIAE